MAAAHLLWLWLAMAATCSRLFIHQKLPLDERAPTDYDDDKGTREDDDDDA